MRVYQVLSPAKFGGAETVCLSLSAALASIGVECTVVMLASDAISDALTSRADRLGLSPIVLRHGRRAYHRDVWALRRLVANDRNAVLHSHLARANLATRGAALVSRCPCVATLHGHSGATARDMVHILGDRSVLRTMDAVVAVSHTSAATARRRTPRFADRIVEIPSGLLPESGLERAAARQELELRPDATVIGWVGRLAPQKHPELFVQSVAEMARRAALPEPWQAVMMGDGPLLTAAQDAARALDVAGRITFAGFRPDAGRFASGFDVLAMTSRSEELPTVLLESLCRGVPAVSTPVGDVPYIAERCGAVKLCDATPHRVADALTDLLTMRGCRDSLASIARRYIAQFHEPAAWAHRHRELYESLLQRRNRPAVLGQTIC